MNGTNPIPILEYLQEISKVKDELIFFPLLIYFYIQQLNINLIEILSNFCGLFQQSQSLYASLIQA